MESGKEQPSLKLKTARSIKWNTIDRVATQLLYAVVGVVLANILSKEDFGLVGILLAFQAFAALFVDSGFGTALLQRKDPTERDYSTVFWFNLGTSLIIYALLFLCAPLIADAFHGDRRLIPLSKVMFLTFVINGLAIVQTNRMIKRMDVRHLAIANSVGLAASGIVAVALALAGFGVWSLVWQYVVLAVVKTAWLWVAGKWTPRGGFHLDSLRKIWRVGLSVFSSSMLNILCLQAYTLVIGAFYSFSATGVYTQAEKWSKMACASVSQILTATFVPLLSKVQNDAETYRRYVKKINRFTGFLLFPVMFGLAVIGGPLFHTLFGNKWDEAIPLFQILTLRGAVIVLTSLYNNYILSLGRAGRIFAAEVIKDSLILIAILATVWSGSLTVIVWGQMVATLVSYFMILVLTSRVTGYPVRNMLVDLLPSLALATVMGILCLLAESLVSVPLLQFLLMLGIGTASYIFMAWLVRLPELSDASGYLLGRFRKKKL